MSNDVFISSTWPWLWTWDQTSTLSFDSTDPQWTFDGGQVRGGGIVTRNNIGPNSPMDRLSVTRTVNLPF
jgi:hypothetical protein